MKEIMKPARNRRPLTDSKEDFEGHRVVGKATKMRAKRFESFENIRMEIVEKVKRQVPGGTSCRISAVDFVGCRVVGMATKMKTELRTHPGGVPRVP